jgi:hypothetical protein
LWQYLYVGGSGETITVFVERKNRTLVSVRLKVQPSYLWGEVLGMRRSERLVTLMQPFALFAFAMERQNSGRDGYDKHDADEKRKQRQKCEHDRSLLWWD